MSEIKTAEQRIHKLEGGEGDSFVTFEQALIAERDELRAALADRDARLAALEGAYIPTYLERLAASPATLEVEFTALRSEALDLRAALAERDAKLAALEKQEPVDAIAVDDMSDGYDKRYGRVLVATENCIKPLYAAAGAAPKPTKTVDRAWSRFCGCIGRGPDAPYPGMIEAFESHYGQNFTDKDWRNETGIWAAAWGYATRQAGAAPVPEPEGWQPIETAPKGSKAILVHCSERKNTYVATWRLNDEFPWSGKWALFGGDLLNEVPTHWMSLPAAPKEPT